MALQAEDSEVSVPGAEEAAAPAAPSTSVPATAAPSVASGETKTPGRISGAEGVRSGDIAKITVTNPQRHGSGPSSYISYKVYTETNLQAFDQSRFTVYKRYSDFDWLRKLMVRTYPGVIVPSLPEKSMMRSTESTFIETRRRGLQTFLNRCSRHETLSVDETFRSFLQDPLEAFEEHKRMLAEKQQTNRAASGGWRSKLFKSARTAYQGAVGGDVTPPVERTEEDLLFDEINDYVRGLTPQLANTLKHTTAMVQSGKELGSALFEFGEAFKGLQGAEKQGSQSESLTAALGRVGMTADGLSAATAETAQRLGLRFHEQIKDYSRMMASVQEALANRTAAQREYWGALEEEKRREAAHSKLASQPGKEVKAQKAQEEWKAAMTRSEEAKKSFEKVSATLFREIAVFKAEKVRDFRAMLLDFIQLQIDHSKKVEAEWSGLIPDLEQITHVPDADSAARMAQPPQAAAGATSTGSQHTVGDSL